MGIRHGGWIAVFLLVPFTIQAQSGGKDHDRKKGQASSQDLVLHLEVRRVPLDVVVTDKDGNAVRGLKKDDFVVEEDSKRQHVLSFDYFDGSEVTPAAAKMPNLPENTFINLPATPERGPLYILYYDMVNTTTDDQMSFHKQLLDFVDQAQPGTRIALFVNAQGLHMLQGFTSDHALLRQAILRSGPGPHVPKVFIYGANYGSNDVGAALSNLTFISEYLAGIPGRKNLIWLATMFPIPVGPALVGRNTATAGQPPQLYSVGAQGGPTVLDLTELEQSAVKATYSSMMRSQVALYPISLSGVLVDTATDYQYLDTIAQSTGGRAYYSNNREVELMNKAVDNGESYYTLTYAPSNQNYDGSERHVRVTLAKKQKRYTLNYRTGYYAVSDEGVQEQHKKQPLQAHFLAAKQSDALFANTEHGAPLLHDLLFSAHLAMEGAPRLASEAEMKQIAETPAYVHAHGAKAAEKALPPVKLQTYRIDYGVFDAKLKPAARQRGVQPALDFAVAAYDADGVMLNSLLNQGVAISDSEQGKSRGIFHAEQRLEVPPGAAYLRMVVRDPLNERMGTMEVSLPLQPEKAEMASKAN